jgi:hypothetical protein
MNKLWHPRSLEKLAQLCKEPFLLVIAFFASLTAVPLIQAPFSNPHNISNPLNSIGFNPASNYTMIIFIIVTTLLLFLLMKRLYSTKYAWTIKLIVVGILLSNHFIFNMLNISSGYYLTDIIYANGPHSLDNFHSGEQLSPANAFLSGTDLYSDIFYLRGAGVDVFIPALGFILFGKSIGSFLLINHLLMLVTMFSFFALMAIVVRGTFKYIIAITLFYVSNAMSLVEIRDIPVWIVLGLILYLFKKDIPDVRKKVALAAIGLLSSLELYIAIDRGMLLVALALMLTATLAVITPNKHNIYTFSPKLWRTNSKASLWPALGLTVGFIIPALFLGWQSFAAFLKMTFVEIPAYGGLLVSTKFPSLFSPEYLIWGPIIIAIATGHLLIKLYSSVAAKELNALIPYTLLFLFAVLALKAGSNRIHILKMATVVAPLFFIAFTILIFAIYIAYKNRSKRLQLIAPIAVLTVSFAVFWQPDFTQLLRQPAYSRSDLARYKNMPHSPDSHWIKEETQQVKDYILAHTTPRDYLYVFPSNPAYYYLTDRKNPSRFYASWFADPQPFTNELLADLKKNKPSLIVYEEATWMDAPDSINMKDRLPEVSQWIVQNYKHETKIGNTRILEP